MERKKIRWATAGLLAVAVACIMGCEDGDSGGETGTDTRATNSTNGAEASTEVEVPEELTEGPLWDEDEGVSSAPRFSGPYSGGYENENGRTDMRVELINAGGVLSGTFTTTGGAAGSLSGTQRETIVRVLFREDGSGRKMTFQGTLNETGSIFGGTWTDNLGNSGDCWLRRMK